jgi:hypothetical protein
MTETLQVLAPGSKSVLSAHRSMFAPFTCLPSDLFSTEKEMAHKLSSFRKQRAFPKNLNQFHSSCAVRRSKSWNENKKRLKNLIDFVKNAINSGFYYAFVDFSEDFWYAWVVNLDWRVGTGIYFALKVISQGITLYFKWWVLIKFSFKKIIWILGLSFASNYLYEMLPAVLIAKTYRNQKFGWFFPRLMRILPIF